MPLVLQDQRSFSARDKVYRVRSYSIVTPVNDSDVIKLDYARSSLIMSMLRYPDPSFIGILRRYNNCDFPIITQAEWFFDIQVSGPNELVRLKFRLPNSSLILRSGLSAWPIGTGTNISTQEIYSSDGCPAAYFYDDMYQIVTRDFSSISAGTPTKLLSNNPRRVMFTIGQNPLGNAMYTTDGNQSTSFIVSNDNIISSFHIRDYGPLVTGELWLENTTGAGQFSVTEIYRIH